MISTLYEAKGREGKVVAERMVRGGAVDKFERVTRNTVINGSPAEEFLICSSNVRYQMLSQSQNFP